MGNILLLTDFSESSLRAAEWALLFAEKSRANLIIFHSFLGVPVISYDTYTDQRFESGPFTRIDEKLQKVLSEFARRAELKIPQNDPKAFKPAIETELGEGHLGNNVRDLIDKKDIELVVMGASGKTTLGHMLMGNKIGQVIEKSNKPVLIAPVQSKPLKLDKITFAVNFDNSEIRAFHLLAHLSELFGFNVEVVHVIIPGESNNDEAKQTLMDNLTNGNKIVGIGYHAVKGKNVLSRLYRECKQNACDLLAMTHRQYNLMQRLLHKSTTREALKDQKIPLLIFPSKEVT
ncbi:MAG: universal stress protein [Bacteroidetes bacterium]|jgi:nucleotide-binding universal stress UspA family protein|nr:universal stress protein [Bacteroidota bacterium]